MTTDNKIKGLPNDGRITALYCRLSVDDIEDEKEGDEAESNSIKNQKLILEDFCVKNGVTNYRFFTDDGITGTTFDRPGFMEMQRLVEAGQIGAVVVKDLSRFGRENNYAGHYAEIVYPSYGVTFISLQEHVNSFTGEGMEVMPFYNIFNEMYASQTSQKIRQVWKVKSEHGERVSSTVAYGYKLGEIEEKRYRRLIKEYESEQYDLEPQVEKSKKELETFDQRSVDLRLLLKTVREQTDVKELTPALVNSLIERIEVHNNDKYDGHCHVKVDIYFTVVGMMNVPDEKEIQAMMEEMNNNPKTLKYVS